MLLNTFCMTSDDMNFKKLLINNFIPHKALAIT